MRKCKLSENQQKFADRLLVGANKLLQKQIKMVMLKDEKAILNWIKQRIAASKETNLDDKAEMLMMEIGDSRFVQTYLSYNVPCQEACDSLFKRGSNKMILKLLTPNYIRKHITEEQVLILLKRNNYAISGKIIPYSIAEPKVEVLLQRSKDQKALKLYYECQVSYHPDFLKRPENRSLLAGYVSRNHSGFLPQMRKLIGVDLELLNRYLNEGNIVDAKWLEDIYQTKQWRLIQRATVACKEVHYSKILDWAEEKPELITMLRIEEQINKGNITRLWAKGYYDLVKAMVLNAHDGDMPYWMNYVAESDNLELFKLVEHKEPINGFDILDIFGDKSHHEIAEYLLTRRRKPLYDVMEEIFFKKSLPKWQKIYLERFELDAVNKVYALPKSQTMQLTPEKETSVAPKKWWQKLFNC